MKGICFKEPLFHKVVAGEKTQTRRIIIPPKGAYGLMIAKDNQGVVTGVYGYDANERTERPDGREWIVKPRYEVGEILFLKEPYCFQPYDTGKIDPYYRYGEMVTPIKAVWKNKLFMPEKYARHFIKIIDVTAQKAHNITEAEAILEGCKNKAEFENWWIKIHGISSWQDNPWVWKYTFENIYEL